MTFRNGSVWLVALVTTGCLYGFQGGGGLPPHIEFVNVPTVENQTTRFPLTEQVTQGLLDAVSDRLGGQVASLQNADAVIRITLTDYRDEAADFQAREDVGAEIFQRRVTLTARVEIRDLVNDLSILNSTVRGTGEYTPDRETEEVGIDLAVENLIQQVVDGAQRQW